MTARDILNKLQQLSDEELDKEWDVYDFAIEYLS